MKTTNGYAAALASWYQAPEAANGPEHGETRERVLNGVYRFEAYGVRGQDVILRGPEGRTIVTRTTLGGSPIFDIDHRDKGTERPLRFWMNASSLDDLGALLRAHRDKRVAYDDILLNF